MLIIGEEDDITRRILVYLDRRASTAYGFIKQIQPTPQSQVIK